WHGHLARGREQARCLFHKMKIHLLWDGTGKMPVPQDENSSFVARASCPWKGTGKMPVPQDENSSFVEGNRQDACSTR
ncbi:hypothetical protein QUA00_21605, partial [Microcoleus sp. T2B6]